jgi:hypothetical protein
MTKTARYGKIVLFTALLIGLLCVAAAATAESTYHTSDHIWVDRTMIKGPTCSAPAQYEYTCSLCGAKNVVGEGTYDPNSNHVWGPWIDDTSADCTTGGHRHRVCTLNVHHTEEQTVNPLGHNLVEEVVRPATCTSIGLKRIYCTRCGQTVSTEDIPMTAHIPGAWEVTVAATCTSTGTQIQKCINCGTVVNTQTIPAKGHTWTAWVVTKQPTCTAPGEQSRNCSVCGAIETQPYGNMLGHSFGAWQAVTAATCTTPGTERRTCVRCGIEETRDVAALGHLWAEWLITKSATCTETGIRTHTCRRDTNHVEREEIPALGHSWGNWITDIQPTCTTPGREHRLCSRGDAREDREMPILPHNWVDIGITKQPTFYEEGEKTQRCTVGGETRVTAIPRLVFPDAHVCAFGPRLRDENLYPYSSDKWYYFTPFDASINGTQTYELVASDMVIVGEVTLTIRDGYLTIDYSLKGNNSIRVNLEFFTVLNRIGDISQYEPEQLMHLKMNRNTPYNLYERFGDDTHLVLYFNSLCYVEYHPAFVAVRYDSAGHKDLLRIMHSLMD